MKFVVSVAVELDADDPEAAAANAYALLTGNVPRTLFVADATLSKTEIHLDYATARDLKAVGKSITAKEIREILARN